MLKKITVVLFFLSIGSTLLNSHIFGGPSMTSLFLFAISILLFGIISSYDLAFVRHVEVKKIPLYVFAYIVFAAYILGHGIVTDTLTLVHFYVLICLFAFLSMHTWMNFLQIKKTVVYRGVAIIALLESFIVLLQFLRICPVPSKEFSCTGTWGNPNVTATFLAMSLFSVKKMSELGSYKKYVLISFSVISTISVILLQCRTAFIVTGIFWIYYFISFNIEESRVNKAKIYPIIIVSIITVVLTIYGTKAKIGSSNSRFQIAQNCLMLIKKHPFIGHGFGKFERVYNEFATEQHNAINDHVNMAYNDFLQLGVEGGCLAIISWLFFLLCICATKRTTQKEKNEVIAIVTSFVIIQLTNFGFDSIPVFVLFLFYCASIPNRHCKDVLLFKRLPEKKIFVSSLSLSLIAGLFLLTISLSSAFYKNKSINKEMVRLHKNGAINQLKELQSRLGFSADFYENMGDAYFDKGDFSSAIRHYKSALTLCCYPDILTKCGYCYQRLYNYDSSAHYFKFVSSMQPHRFQPRFFLLKMYQQKGDSIMVMKISKEIIGLDVKIPSLKIDSMKRYARYLVDSMTVQSYTISNKMKKQSI